VRIVKVPLGNRSYNIKIGTGLLARIGRECARLGSAADALSSPTAMLRPVMAKPRKGL
jgi:hypothetical protein